VVVSAVVGFVVLLSASVYSFHALTDETLIAELEFDRVSEQSYVAHLRTADLCSVEQFAIFGDQWRVDAQFLKWHYWASLFGLDSQYRLERLEGRYRDVDDQNRNATFAHALAAPSAIDIGALSGRLGKVNFLADVSYGSSVYHDIDTSKVYLVYKSPTGLIARTRERLAPQQDSATLTVEVRRGCGEEPGFLANAADWINRTVDRSN
jgi:hypothetical protein